MPTANRLPRSGSHSPLVCSRAPPFASPSPTSDTASVTSDENNDQARAPPSLLIRKPSNPLTRGITISNTGIIAAFFIPRPPFGRPPLLFLYEQLHQEQHDDPRHHQQDI